MDISQPEVATGVAIGHALADEDRRTAVISGRYDSLLSQVHHRFQHPDPPGVSDFRLKIIAVAFVRTKVCDKGLTSAFLISFLYDESHSVDR